MMPGPPRESPVPAPKRIIICCDGTWQSAVSGQKNSPSNVTRLARCLERAAVDEDDNTKVWQQIVWYDSGVGTTSSKLGKMTEGAVGAGLEGNVIEAYNFLVLNYNSGDQVLCFGFSRGAYTARAIAGLVSDIGICEPRNMHHFPEIWELYKKGKAGERFYGSDTYWDWVDGKKAETQADEVYDPATYNPGRFLKWDIPPHGDWASDPKSREIEVCAVYDTVGALGLPRIRGHTIWPFGPDKTGFHNVQLNRNIKHAFHALALDEHREAFTPTLWWIPVGEDGKPLPKPTAADIEKQQAAIDKAQAEFYKLDDNKKATQEKKEKKDKAKLAFNESRRKMIRMQEDLKEPSELLQVWFPGVHISVGGGSSDTLEDKGDLEELSNVTFAWMLDQIGKYVGIKHTTIFEESTARSRYIAELNEAVRQYKKLREEREDEAKKSWKSWASQKATSWTSAAMRPFTSVKEPDEKRRDRGWATGAFIESYTTMYLANGSKPRTPGQYEKDKVIPVKGITNEQVHPTVGYRMLQTENLREADQYHPLGEYTSGEKKGQKKVKRQKVDDGSFEYVMDGVPLPEYKMKPSFQLPGKFSFERLASGEGTYENNETAAAYIRDLDLANGFPVEERWTWSAENKEDN